MYSLNGMLFQKGSNYKYISYKDVMAKRRKEEKKE
jgi:hypothetical protein